jgi:hypothetical protein
MLFSNRKRYFTLKIINFLTLTIILLFCVLYFENTMIYHNNVVPFNIIFIYAIVMLISLVFFMALRRFKWVRS